jgi:arsenical pump membrane protein
MLVLPDPALPVLTVGMLAVLTVMTQGRTHTRRLLATVDVTTLIGLFGLALAAGTLARTWTAPGLWLSHAGRWQTAALASAAAIAVNNLPAAMLLSAQPVPHPRALLVGLDIGPNIAITGSLSALLWIQAARSVGSHPSIRIYSLIGSVSALLAIPGALLITSTS